jgi:DNA-binding NarL/FixJ family response regulator
MPERSLVIIDPDLPRNQIMAEKLADDYKVFFAATTDKGLELIKKNDAKLVILEIDSIKEHLDYIRKINKLFFNIKVIVVSNNIEKQTLEKLRVLGVKNYFLKTHNSMEYIIEKILAI